MEGVDSKCVMWTEPAPSQLRHGPFLSSVLTGEDKPQHLNVEEELQERMDSWEDVWVTMEAVRT